MWFFFSSFPDHENHQKIFLLQMRIHLHSLSKAGVRQGGVLSPLLFTSYVDVVIEKTISHEDGCHVGVHNMCIFMYAYDLVLLSPSVCHLQRMVNVVADEIADLDMTVNTNIGLKNCKSAFYKSFNAIYSKIFKSNENLILTLDNTYCIPALYYGLEAVDLNLSDADSWDQPIMRALRKVFKTYDRSVLYWWINTLTNNNNNNTQLVTRHMSVNAYSYISERTESQTNVCIMQDLNKIFSKFEIDVNDHFHSIKNKLLFDFGSTLSLC